MKKRIIPITLIAMCLLSSCSQTPDNIQGNNHNVDLNSENNKVSVEHILDDFDKAFETEYSKFKLPDKSSVIINQPEEVCDLELKYVNADKSMDWLKERVYKLADIFNVQNYGNLKNVGDIAYALENEKEKVRTDVFSVPYYCSNDDWDINQMKISKIEHLDRKQINNINKEYVQVTNKSIKCANDICSCFGGVFSHSLIDLYVRDYKGKTFYELSLQPIYKNIGIQCINSTNNNDYENGDDVILADAFDIRFLYNINLKLYLYYGCNNYIPVKDEAIEKIISLKGACDILESQLAENMTLEFDDVKLWYEPRGTILDATSEDGFDGTKTIKCTPKWYFISDEENGDFHGISYVTVDCVTGEVEVVV